MIMDMYGKTFDFNQLCKNRHTKNTHKEYLTYKDIENKMYEAFILNLKECNKPMIAAILRTLFYLHDLFDIFFAPDPDLNFDHDQDSINVDISNNIKNMAQSKIKDLVSTYIESKATHLNYHVLIIRILSEYNTIFGTQC